ncbi:carboxypeptidase G2 [Brucella sp. NBRC 12952]|uniref:M20/M25/M40 family metallo-hydrolase n=1 Tax=Brucella pseudogrignonensis TaxID=419475 RepID=A0A256G157_9HYPH|nr:M20/M25/M40 family metallo-hydrolase [Brucella pseudogrignonensis]NNV20117.1 M20/M25/M40 family metallo-hydrolase [Brucella pseudogrignonensis]OYR20824.1 peptidase dimerization domain protein [Brucella pseudogrignonensis]
MSTHELPFNLDDMIARLRPWIETESPTFDASAVNRMVEVAAYDFAAAGATIEFIPGRMGFGGSLRARFPHKDQGKPGILVSGHLDTVHPLGVININPYRREDGKLYGPGIQDMKGGNFVALEAMREIARSGLATKLPVTFLLTPDEEVGTPSTRDLIEQEALKNKYVLVPEPALRDGGAVVGRYAIARYNLETVGKPSHAGWLLKEGRSAIRRMAEKIIEIEALTTDDCTFSVGVIHAGQWVNCVSSSCNAEALSMAKTQKDLEDGVARIMALGGDKDGVELIITRGVTRPVWEPGQPQDMKLFNFANDIAKEIGFTMSVQSSGGGSDGNFTGALGVPTIDSIGVRGEGLHTLGEHIFEDSLVERARLHAGLFLSLE